MKRYFLCAICILLYLISPLLGQQRYSAQWRIRDTAHVAIKVAVNPVEIKGTASSEDSALARQIFQVISEDLDFHFILDTVMVDTFLLKVYETDYPDLTMWGYMQANHVLDLSASFSDNKIRLDYSLKNVLNKKESASDSYRMERDFWRLLAHTISDEVVERLTGYPGIFRTMQVFVSAQTGNKEIYICDYDGANVQAVTKNGSINISPIWDAKNEAILYTSYKNGTPDLWQADLNGGGHSLVASYPGINSAPAVAPNNKDMVLTLSKDGNAELYLTDRKGKIKHRLTNSPSIETAPSFSPSGKELAFTSDRTGAPQIYMMDIEGLNVRRITYVAKQNESPAISPDGTKIAYVTRNDEGGFHICVAEIDGSDYRVITNSGFNENPRWAPDGLHLVYSTRWGDRTALYISDYLGLKKRLISNQPGCSNPCWSGFMR